MTLRREITRITERWRGEGPLSSLEIDYIDKVPYRVVDTRSTVNGKGTNIKTEEATVASLRVYLCAEPRVHG